MPINTQVKKRSFKLTSIKNHCTRLIIPRAHASFHTYIVYLHTIIVICIVICVIWPNGERIMCCSQWCSRIDQPMSFILTPLNPALFRQGRSKDDSKSKCLTRLQYSNCHPCIFCLLRFNFWNETETIQQRVYNICN